MFFAFDGKSKLSFQNLLSYKTGNIVYKNKNKKTTCLKSSMITRHIDLFETQLKNGMLFDYTLMNLKIMSYEF